MGAEHSRMYSSITLAPVTTPMQSSGSDRLVSQNLERLIIARPLHGWHTHATGTGHIKKEGSPSADGAGTPTKRADHPMSRSLGSMNGIYTGAVNYVYDISGRPILAVQPHNHGNELDFVHAGDEEEAFTVHKVPGALLHGPAVQLLSRSGEIICDGRRMNHQGGSSAKFGLFLPGQEEPWIVIKGDSERDDMFVFVGHPKTGGQLIARIHKRPNLHDFHPHDITAKEADTFYDCRLAPGVDWAVLIAIVVLTDSHAASGAAAM